MPKAFTIWGRGDARAPSAWTAEGAAQEYFTNRQLVGMFAPRPPIEKWHSDQRERFLAELDRLEAKNRAERGDAARASARLSEGTA